MVRYFFHYRNENGLLIEDRFGSEHSGLDAVEDKARHQARDTFEEEIQAGGDPQAPRCIEVVNERGIEVLYLPFWASYRILDGQRGTGSDCVGTPAFLRRWMDD